jgi:hypothetical protein
MKSQAALLAVMACVLTPCAVQAQATADGVTVRQTEIDTSIPESPGFSVIGLSPTQVIDPSAGRITAAGLASYVDEKGNLKPGFALGGAPYLWFRSDLTLMEYRKFKGVEAVLARTQLSLGFAEGGDGKADKIGIGFSAELLGHGDYRKDLELYDCVRRAFSEYDRILDDRRREIRRVAREDAASQLNPTGGPVSKELARLISEKASDLSNERENELVSKMPPKTAELKACRQAALKRYSERESMVLAGGWSFKANGGGVDSAESDGGSVWWSYRRPMNTGLTNYLTLFARYDFDRTPDTPAATQKYDRTTAALLAGREWETGEKASLEIGYERLNYRGAGPLKDTEDAFYALTLSRRLNLLSDENVWIEVKAASASSSALPGDRDDTLTVGLRFSPSMK